MRAASIQLGAAILATVGGLGLVWHAAWPTPAAPPLVTLAEVAPGAATPARARPAAAGAAATRGGPTSPATAPPAPGAPVDPGTALRAQLDAERREREVQRAQLASVITRQPRDPAWAAAIERDLGTSLAALPREGTSVETVECRSQLCRVVLRHPHHGAQTDAMQALAGQPGFTLAGRAHLEYDAQGAVTYLFLARDREHFPDIATL